MYRGFLSIAVMVIIGATSLVVAGGGYGAYKYTQVVKEKESIELKLLDQKDREIEQLKQQLKSDEATTTTDTHDVQATSSEKNHNEVDYAQEVDTNKTSVQSEQDAYEELKHLQQETKDEVEALLTDECWNIEGVQQMVPFDYSQEGNICTLIPVEDKCPNIDGAQPEVPDGLMNTKEVGCVTEEEYDDYLESQKPEPEPEPELTYIEIRMMEVEDEISDLLAKMVARYKYAPEANDTVKWSSRDSETYKELLAEYGVYETAFDPPYDYMHEGYLDEIVVYWEAWISKKYNKEFEVPYRDYKP